MLAHLAGHSTSAQVRSFLPPLALSVEDVKLWVWFPQDGKGMMLYDAFRKCLLTVTKPCRNSGALKCAFKVTLIALLILLAPHAIEEPCFLLEHVCSNWQRLYPSKVQPFAPCRATGLSRRMLLAQWPATNMSQPGMRARKRVIDCFGYTEDGMVRELSETSGSLTWEVEHGTWSAAVPCPKNLE